MKKRTRRRFRRYIRAIEGLDAYRCILDELLNREKLRLICIQGVSVYVRTNTPDIRVAINSLFVEEYKGVRCSDPKFIIDAGANIGTSAVYFARRYPNAQIIAVEPEEGNFDMLLRNTKDYGNITAIKAAIWGSAEKRAVHNRDTGHWGYTVAETRMKSEPTGQEIDCVTVNSLMEEFAFDRVDLLKMDIEGGEKDVLTNSSGWISKVEILMAELHDRICMGCDRAFYLATRDFKAFEKHGDKVTAYRHEV